MSKGTLGQVVKRAISDAGFRRQLQSDPEGALKGFDLTADERAALRSGDASKLSSFGIDQRMSKAFALGEGASAVSKWGTGHDFAMGATMPDGGEPLVSDGLVSGGGGSANDALIGEASGAKGARISDAGGSVRTTVTDADRLGQVNAAFAGGDAAPAGRDAFGDQHDIARGAISDSPASGVRNALGDQHDGGRSAIGSEADRLAQVNAAFEGGDSAAGGRSALGDQHDIARGAISDSPASGVRNALGDQHDVARSAISGDVAGREGDAFITADESGRDVAARGTQDFGQQSSLDVSGNTRDASLITGDAAGRPTDAYITADESGRDASPAAAAAADSSATTAFMTADELGNDTVARVVAPDPDTAITQREALDGAAMANPEGYDRPDVVDS